MRYSDSKSSYLKYVSLSIDLDFDQSVLKDDIQESTCAKDVVQRTSSKTVYFYPEICQLRVTLEAEKHQRKACSVTQSLLNQTDTYRKLLQVMNTFHEPGHCYPFV